MTVKRIMSLLLSVLIIMCSMLTISAAAPTITEDKASSSGYNWVFVVTADVSGRMNAMITGKDIPVDSDDDGAGVYSAAPQRVYDIERGVEGVLDSESGKYKYTFTFTMPKDAPSLLDSEKGEGKYKVTIGNNVATQSAEFTYVSIAGRLAFYDSIIGLTADTAVRSLLTPDSVTANPNCSIDLSGYITLANTYPAVATLVDKELYAMKSDFAAIKNNNTDYPTDVQKLTAMESELNAKFIGLLRIAEFESIYSTNWDTAVQDCFDDSIFEDKYFDTVDPTSEAVEDKFQLTIAEIEEYFTVEKVGIAFDKDAYSEAFDKATTVAIINKGYDNTTNHAVMAALKADHPALFTSATYLAEALDNGTKLEIWSGLDTFTDCDDLISKLDVLAQNTTGGGESSEPSDDNLPPQGSSTTTPQRPTGGAGVSTPPQTITPTPSDPKPVDPKPEEPASPSKVFADMKGFDWAVEAVEYFAEKGVISGKEEGKFAPADGVTREQGAKIITLAFDLYDENIETVDFADVSSEGWSALYVASAVKAGIFQGYGETFGATDVLTREQGATVLYRLLVELGYEFTTEPKEFTDDADIADYAKEAVSMLAGAGVIDGMGDGTFAPKTTLNRAQLAALAYRVVQLTIS